MSSISTFTIPGLLLEHLDVHVDQRGTFTTHDPAFPTDTAQVATSWSRAGTLRGIHYAARQAKYVVCLSGEIIDVAVDLRVGSPTYGQHVATRLHADNPVSVYVDAGLGHGFCAITDAVVLYLLSAPYDPAEECEVNPYDPALGIDWPVGSPVLSGRDRNAPTLAEAEAAGLLPVWGAS